MAKYVSEFNSWPTAVPPAPQWPMFEPDGPALRTVVKFFHDEIRRLANFMPSFIPHNGFERYGLTVEVHESKDVPGALCMTATIHPTRIGGVNPIPEQFQELLDRSKERAGTAFWTDRYEAGVKPGEGE